MDDNALTKYPSVARIVNDRFGGNTFQQESVTALPAGLSKLLSNDPNRARWAVINEGANDVMLSNSPDVTATSGWRLVALGGVITMDWTEDGEAVTYDVYVFVSALPSNIRVREVIIQ